jgi:lysophospholipase L1-like esterase
MRESGWWQKTREALLPCRKRQRQEEAPAPAGQPEKSGKLRRVASAAWLAGLLTVLLLLAFGASAREIAFLVCGLIALGLVTVAASASGMARLTNATRAKIFLVAVSLCFAAALAEMGLRFFFHGDFRVRVHYYNLQFGYDPVLGWFPVQGSRGDFVGSRLFHIAHNRLGFRGPEPVQDGRPRIMFLGDSFVWGYDAEEPERFTEKLQVRHPEWNILNFGVSGYGTDQEYLLLQRVFEPYKPRLVFLVVCAANDLTDNCTNRQGEYFKPYFSCGQDQLKLEGVPVPQGERVFMMQHKLLSRSYLIRLLVAAYSRLAHPLRGPDTDPTFALLKAIRTYVRQRGANFAVGLTASMPSIERLLKHEGIPYVDLSTSRRYPSETGEHWSPEGHDFVCDKIEGLLTNLASVMVATNAAK